MSAARFAAGLLAGLALPAQQPAAELLAGMSVAQKAAQTIQVWTLSRAGQAERERILGWVRELELGGVILSLGTTAQAQARIAELQQASRIPLLCSADFETSVAFRLTGATDFGNAMLLGATGLPRLAEAAGRATAREAAALGFHWAFAPVADVNVDPANPIIHVRSFGELPEQVARFAAATVRGLESGGLLATAKHFPGHGDVAVDSHLALPTVPGDRARLERVELVPFRAAIEAGVSSVMTGHLAVPGLGEQPTVPATLSPKILGLLRDELRFDGIIVTDALDMGGVREKVAPELAAVQALAAGADVLLMPPDPRAARDAIVAAIAAGRLDPARLDDAVRRILLAKERCGLLGAASRQPTPFSTHEHLALAGEIAARGITLVRDRGLVPLPPAERMLLLAMQDRDGAPAAFADALAARAARSLTVHPDLPAAALEQAAAAVAAADLVVAALDVRVRAYAGRIGLPPAFAPIAAALRRHPRAVAISFGNPYLLAELPEVGAYLCAFTATPATVAAAATILRGEAPVTGRLPVTIPGSGDAPLAAVGSGRSRFWHADLDRVAPEQEGLRAALPAELRARLEQAVAERVTPGAVLAVSRRGRIVVELAVGNHDYGEPARPVTTDTPYDLASLTKVCATLPVILRLVAAQRLALDQRVQSLLPEFTGDGKADVTIRDLLAHCAGLPPFVRWFAAGLRGRDEILAAAMREPLATAPGRESRYSDLGPLLLMACAERVTRTPFERLVAREVTGPLGMRSARFSTADAPVDAPPTELDPWRGRVVRGEVHDENAAAMGGVAGHAGLFGTARDVLRIGHAFLGGGAAGWLPPELVAVAVQRDGRIAGSSRALGWDGFVAGGSGGSRLSPSAFGHTGFTGTSIWCDPATDLCFVLLTNRVHPSRAEQQIRELRRDLADRIAGAIE